MIENEQKDQHFAAIDKAATECVYCLDENQAKSDIKNIRQVGKMTVSKLLKMVWSVREQKNHKFHFNYLEF